MAAPEVGYDLSAVWVDPAAGSAGTVNYTNGIVSSKVDTAADALTIMGSLGLRRMVVVGVLNGGSDDLTDIQLMGINASLTAWTGSVAGSLFQGFSVAGELTGYAEWSSCSFSDTSFGTGCSLQGCDLSGSIMLGAASYLYGCQLVDNPTISLNSAAVSVEMHNSSGDATVTNMVGGATLLITGSGVVTVASSCTGGTITASGSIKLVDSASGAVTFVDNTTHAQNVAIETDTQNIQSRIPAALEGGRMASSVGGYVGGAVWIDAVNGVSGTVPDINGTVTNPSDTMANAATVAAAKGLRLINILGSDLTVSSNMTGYELRGIASTDSDGDPQVYLTLSASVVTQCRFVNLSLSLAEAAATDQGIFDWCAVAGWMTPGNNFRDCKLSHMSCRQVPGYSTILLERCGPSTKAGTTLVYCPANSPNPKEILATAWSGAMLVKNMGVSSTNDRLEVSGTGTVTLDSSNVGGTVTLYGNIQLVNNGSGMTIVDNTTHAQNTAIETDTQNIQTRLPAALVSGRMDSDVGNMQDDTVTADAVATDAFGALEIAEAAANEFRDAILNRALAGNHESPGTVGKLLLDGLTGNTPQTGDAFARLSAYRLGELFALALTGQPEPASLLADLTEDDGGQQRFNANALEEAAGSGSAGAQAIRDAMQLAPTAGGYADLSIDDKLDKWGSALIAGGTVHVRSLITTGKINLVQGDDYLTAQGTEYQLRVTDATGEVYSRLTAAGVTSIKLGAGGDIVVGTISKGAITTSLGVVTIPIDFAAADMSTAETDHRYKYQVQTTDSGGRESSILGGVLVVAEDEALAPA